MAIYTFITDKDLDVGMKKYFRDQVIETNYHILAISEGAAFSMIKSKLTSRYDIIKLFPEIKEWSSTANYLIDDFAYKSDKIYKAIVNNTASDPTTVSPNWKESDPRDQLLVVFCVRMTLFFLMESMSLRKTPDDIINDFTSAMEWLEACKSGEENPDWPLLVDGNSIVNWGSNPKLDHYY